MVLHLRSSAFAAAFLVALMPASLAATWSPDPEASSLTIVAIQTNEEFSAQFTSFAADISLDPENLADASIRVVVDTGSFASGSGDRDTTAQNADWFDVGMFPEAVFVSNDVVQVEGNSYNASGTLTIKGNEQPVDLPFTLDIEGDRAIADGSITLNRLNYDVGVGPDWEDGIFIGLEVTVSFHIEATRVQ